MQFVSLACLLILLIDSNAGEVDLALEHGVGYSRSSENNKKDTSAPNQGRLDSHIFRVLSQKNTGEWKKDWPPKSKIHRDSLISDCLRSVQNQAISLFDGEENNVLAEWVAKINDQDLIDRLRTAWSVPQNPTEVVRRFILLSFSEMKKKFTTSFKNLSLVDMAAVYARVGVPARNVAGIVDSSEDFRRVESPEVQQVIATFKKKGIPASVIAKVCGFPFLQKNYREQYHRRGSKRVKPFIPQPLQLPPVHEQRKGPFQKYFPFKPPIQRMPLDVSHFIGTSSRFNRLWRLSDGH